MKHGMGELAQRRWPRGVVCVFCESAEPYPLARAGVYRCSNPECRRDFSATTGTIMHGSHIAPAVWLEAETCHRDLSKRALAMRLGISDRAAWFVRAKLIANGGALL